MPGLMSIKIEHNNVGLKYWMNNNIVATGRLNWTRYVQKVSSLPPGILISVNGALNEAIWNHWLAK